MDEDNNNSKSIFWPSVLGIGLLCLVAGWSLGHSQAEPADAQCKILSFPKADMSISYEGNDSIIRIPYHVLAPLLLEYVGNDTVIVLKDVHLNAS